MNKSIKYFRSTFQKQKKGQLTLFSLCIIAYRLATCPTSLLMVNNRLRARSASENCVSVKQEKIQHINIRNTLFLLVSFPEEKKESYTNTDKMYYRKRSVKQKCLKSEFFVAHSTIKVRTASFNIYFTEMNLMTDPL
jgi:hypothetical protein